MNEKRKTKPTSRHKTNTQKNILIKKTKIMTIKISKSRGCRMWRIFHKLLVPQNIVMDMNNVMHLTSMSFGYINHSMVDCYSFFLFFYCF